MKKLLSILILILVYSSSSLFAQNVYSIIGEYTLNTVIYRSEGISSDRDTVTNAPNELKEYPIKTISIQQVQDYSILKFSFYDLDNSDKKVLRFEEIIYNNQKDDYNLVFFKDHILNRRNMLMPKFNLKYKDDKLYIFFESKILIFERI